MREKRSRLPASSHPPASRAWCWANSSTCWFPPTVFLYWPKVAYLSISLHSVLQSMVMNLKTRVLVFSFFLFVSFFPLALPIVYVAVLVLYSFFSFFRLSTSSYFCRCPVPLWHCGPPLLSVPLFILNEDPADMKLSFFFLDYSHSERERYRRASIFGRYRKPTMLRKKRRKST